jgi:nascent polypeptide-associated complex subunit alpha
MKPWVYKLDIEGDFVQRRVNPREAKRMMQRMGMSMDAIAEVEQVIIRTSRKEITIQQPEVAILEVQGQKIFQITGGKITEKAAERKLSGIAEEDVKLVADQTGKSVEEARRALEDSGGDLAKAILMLQSKF